MYYKRMIVVTLVDGGVACGLDEKLNNPSINFLPCDESSYFFNGKARDVARQLIDESEECREPLLALVVNASTCSGKMVPSKMIVSDARVSEENGIIYLLVRNSTVIDDGVVVSDLGSYLLIDIQKSDNETGFCRIETSSAMIEKASLYLRSARKEVQTNEDRNRGKCCDFEDAQSSFRLFDGYAQPDLFVADPSIQIESSAMNRVRSHFELDYEKVIQTKAFRRMVDKAQVFSASKGDHYRTRMTHTQEVALVARRISRALGLNEVLAEVIALAHDVGHTPFGHQGERSLQKCLQGLDAEGNPVGPNYAYGGFKHNAQSVRVLSILEDYDGEMSGLGISWQVLEGALWHTKAPIMTEELSDACGSSYLYPSIFCPRGYFQYGCNDCYDRIFHLGSYKVDGSISLTLEGQVVALADEIAQRSHDVDDALSARLLTEDELLDYCKMHCAVQFYDGLVQRLSEKDRDEQAPILYLDKIALDQRRITAYIRDYLIENAIDASTKALKDLKNPPADLIFKKKYVDFSPDAYRVCELLERVVGNRVITSSDVSEVDARASRVVEGLFEAYLDNPLLLPRKTLRKLALLERSNLQHVENGELIGSSLDLSCCSAKAARKEIQRIKDARVCEILKPGKVEKSNASSLKKMLLVRTIVDYISGMTDSFALQEYDRVVN